MTPSRPDPAWRRAAVAGWQRLGTRFLPFADAASTELPLGRLLRLGLFQVSVGLPGWLLDVVLSGVTVGRASLHNVAFIDKLGLSLGARVALVRRGGVIPNVEGVVEPGSALVRVPGAPTLNIADFPGAYGPV